MKISKYISKFVVTCLIAVLATTAAMAAETHSRTTAPTRVIEGPSSAVTVQGSVSGTVGFLCLVRPRDEYTDKEVVPPHYKNKCSDVEVWVTRSAISKSKSTKVSSAKAEGNFPNDCHYSLSVPAKTNLYLHANYNGLWMRGACTGQWADAQEGEHIYWGDGNVPDYEPTNGCWDFVKEKGTPKAPDVPSTGRTRTTPENLISNEERGGGVKSGYLFGYGPNDGYWKHHAPLPIVIRIDNPLKKCNQNLTLRSKYNGQ